MSILKHSLVIGCVKRVRKLSIRDYCGFLKTLGLLNLRILRNLLFFYFKCLDPVKIRWLILPMTLEDVDCILLCEYLIYLATFFFKNLLGEASKLKIYILL